LLNAVRGISDLINNTGHINADFADVATVMANKGLALMGTGSASGQGRAIKAATEAISSPLLEDISINGATGIIINITGNETLSMHETNEAVTLIMEAADENAEIIFGTVIDSNLGDEINITVIATGLSDHRAKLHGQTVQTHSYAQANIQTQVQQAPQAPIYYQQPQVETRMEIKAPVVSETIQQKPIQTPVAAQSVQQVEERSDFDRFMNDKSAFVAKNNEEIHEPIAAQAPENKNPSRLIQSIRDAANRYEGSNRTNERTEFNETFKEPVQTSTRAKSIAEKLGFINFDEDEFDTPSYLRKEEKTEQRPPIRENKNLDM
jgi:cell division protein FtsZ